jgi:hypothetical protein
MQDIEARLDRVESTFAIQQLPIRYALAVDGRDVDSWVNLFVADVNCGSYGTGRDALRRFIEPMLTNFYRSQHFICGHRIAFTDSDNATGRVYCRAEHEDQGHWVIMAICYFDNYTRQHGEWFFVNRKEKHWYASDVLSKPSGPNFSQWPGQPEVPRQNLPEGFPTWRGFWERMGSEAEGKRTKFPVR